MSGPVDLQIDEAQPGSVLCDKNYACANLQHAARVKLHLSETHLWTMYMLCGIQVSKSSGLVHARFSPHGQL